MAEVIGIVVGVIGAVGGAVSGVVGIISGAIGTAVGAVGGAVGGIIGTIGSALSGVMSAIGSVLAGITTDIGGALSGVLEGVTGPIFESVGSVSKGLGEAISDIAGFINNTTAPILNPINDALKMVESHLDAIDKWFVEQLAPIDTLLETVDKIASLKILYDLTTGHAGIMDLLNRVSMGGPYATAAAIAETMKSITTLGVNIVDRLDTQWKLVEANFTTFEDRFKTNFDNLIDLQKTELLGVFTPQINQLGTYQQKVNRDVAKVYRHIEDEAWFAAMLLKVLP